MIKLKIIKSLTKGQMKQIRNQTKKEKNKTYEKLQLNDKIEKKQNFYKRNKDEIRNSKNED